jgi:hypothetical protein
MREEEHKVMLEKEFESMVGGHEYHYELLERKLAEQMEKECGLSGVYIGEVDFPEKSCDVEVDDQEEAHIDKSKAKVIKYIGASHSHAYLKGKVLTND